MIRAEYESGSDIPVFTDGEHAYSRIVGGVGWPCHGVPGCYCVLGRDACRARLFDLPVLRVIAEGRDVMGEPLMDYPTTFKALGEASDEHMVPRWYGMPGYPATELARFNRSRLVGRQRRIAIAPPPLLAERGVPGYLSMVRRRVSSQKTLFFGEHRGIPRALSGLPADIDTIGPDRHPAISAIICAVAAMDLLDDPTGKRPLRAARRGDARAGY
jgi:hypothetical protein